MTSSKGAGHLKRGTDFAEKTICTLCRKRARSGSFFRWGQQGSADTPEGGPLGGAFRATLRPAPRFRRSIPAGARFACASAQKKEGKSLPFFCGGDNRAPPTPPEGGPLGGAFRATLRPCSAVSSFFSRGREVRLRLRTKKRRQKPSFFLWWGQQGSADTPRRGTPRRGVPRDPAPLLRGFVVLFPRARGSPAPPHKKKEGKSLPFFVVERSVSNTNLTLITNGRCVWVEYTIRLQ